MDESKDVKETFLTEVKSVGTPTRMTERQGREDRDERTRRGQDAEKHSPRQNSKFIIIYEMDDSTIQFGL